jgi:RimJ/RimL family protein N-acetyltransferase
LVTLQQEEHTMQWPHEDREGRPVRFTSIARRPRPDEYEPVLQGTAIRLEPMRAEHLDALCRVGLAPELSLFTPSPLVTPGQMETYVQDALAARAAGTAMPFVTVMEDGGPGGSAGIVVGSTRFLNIDRRNRRMEIGSTWIGKRWQRTRVNTEAKLLMLRHAFEVLESIRVEFKTDSLNLRSRAALARIGAREEGVFRSHVITAEGRIRHSVYFAVTAEDWPGVKEHLLRLLER